MTLPRIAKLAILPLGYNTVCSCCGVTVTYVLLTDSKDAFDVIGELTFSKSLGFLERGSDVDGIITALEAMLDYSGKVSIKVSTTANSSNS